MTNIRNIEANALLASAIQVLTESTQPLSCAEMIHAMAFKGSCPPGRTPEHTLYALLVRYQAQHGAHCPIHKTGRGGGALSATLGGRLAHGLLASELLPSFDNYVAIERIEFHEERFTSGLFSRDER